MPRQRQQTIPAFEQPLALGVKGINYTSPPHLVGDNGLCDACNFWLDRYGRFITRPGTTALLGTPIGSSILSMEYYPPDDKIVASAYDTSDSKVHLHALDDDGSNLADLGATNGTSQTFPVQMTMFENELFIATGGILQKYNGTSIANQTSAAGSAAVPQTAATLAVRDNRLFVGLHDSSTVAHTGSSDPTDWGGAAPLNGGSFNIDAGDGGTVRAMEVYSDDLYVFKYGTAQSIHKITGTSIPLTRTNPSRGYASLGYGLAVSIDADLFYCGDSGIYSMNIINDLGDVKSVPLSLTMTPLYDSVSLPLSITYSSYHGMLFVLLDASNMMVYHRGAEAWFRFVFTAYDATCVKAIGNNVYIGSSTGQIYKLDEDVYDDDGTDFPKSFLRPAADFGQQTRRIDAAEFYLTAKVYNPGFIHIDTRTGFGGDYKSTLFFSRQDDIAASWDEIPWDDATYSWDSDGIGEMQAKVSQIGNNFQFQISTTAAIEIYEMSLYGRYNSRRRWAWNG